MLLLVVLEITLDYLVFPGKPRHLAQLHHVVFVLMAGRGSLDPLRQETLLTK